MQRHRLLTLYFFVDNGRWHWWLSRNSRTLARCPPVGYTRRTNAVRAAALLFPQALVRYEPPPGMLRTLDSLLFQDLRKRQPKADLFL